MAGIYDSSASNSPFDQWMYDAHRVKPNYHQYRQWVEAGIITEDDYEAYCNGAEPPLHVIRQAMSPDDRFIDIAYEDE